MLFERYWISLWKVRSLEIKCCGSWKMKSVTKKKTSKLEIISLQTMQLLVMVMNHYKNYHNVNGDSPLEKLLSLWAGKKCTLPKIHLGPASQPGPSDDDDDEEDEDDDGDDDEKGKDDDDDEDCLDWWREARTLLPANNTHRFNNIFRFWSGWSSWY